MIYFVDNKIKKGMTVIFATIQLGNMFASASVDTIS